MSKTKTYDVFISYSRKDSAVADEICRAFDQVGITYFIDRKGMGGTADYLTKIANEIDNSKMMLLLSSAHSHASKYVTIELHYAFNHNVVVLPYALDNAPVPKNFEILLINTNWHYLAQHPICSNLLSSVADLIGKDITTPKTPSEEPEIVTRPANKAKPKKAIKKTLWTLAIAALLVIPIGAAFYFGGKYANDKIQWKYRVLNDSTAPYTIEITGFKCAYNEIPKKISIPKKIKRNDTTYIVTAIGFNAFQDCDSLTSVTIPSSVKYIGGWAFKGCSNLTSISVEQDNYIYDSRGNCNAIIETATNTLIAGCQSTIIPNTVTSIGYWAFEGRTNLTSITIPEGVTSIGGNAFYGCKSLTSVTIPNSVTSIGEYAFSGCKNLKSISVEQGNPIYDSRDNCNAIIETATNTLIVGCQSTIIPNSITCIGDWAFFDCDSWTSIMIPESVTRIGEYAFFGCSNLTSITIPESVTSIGHFAFSRCDNLTSISVAQGNPIFDSRDNCDAIIETATNTLIVGCQSTIIPNTVTSIGDKAFYGCSNLTSVTIPNSVISIGSLAFANCTNLTSIMIPNSVTWIGEGAFYGCKSLTSVMIPESVTGIGYRAFESCENLTSVTIPRHTEVGKDAFPEHTEIILY